MGYAAVNQRYGNFNRGARGKRREPGSMNGLETSFSEELTRRVNAGELLWWLHESMTVKLGPDCRYTPDFLTQMPDGELVIYETKGFMEAKSLVKIKATHTQFPFRIIVVKKRAKKDGGGFAEEEVK